MFENIDDEDSGNSGGDKDEDPYDPGVSGNRFGIRQKSDKSSNPWDNAYDSGLH